MPLGLITSGHFIMSWKKFKFLCKLQCLCTKACILNFKGYNIPDGSKITQPQWERCNKLSIKHQDKKSTHFVQISFSSIASFFARDNVYIQDFQSWLLCLVNCLRQQLGTACHTAVTPLCAVWIFLHLNCLFYWFQTCLQWEPFHFVHFYCHLQKKMRFLQIQFLVQVFADDLQFPFCYLLWVVSLLELK